MVGIVGGATEIYISFDCCLMEMPKFTALFTQMPLPNDKCQFNFGANLYQRILIFFFWVCARVEQINLSRGCESCDND